MDKYAEGERTKQLDQLFNSFDKSALNRKLELSGMNTLDVQGRIRTSQSKGELANMDVGANLDTYNTELAKIDIRLEKDPDGKIEIKFLQSVSDGNTKVLIGPEVAVFENGKFYLKNPMYREST